mgnify:CR=1 FL=1
MTEPQQNADTLTAPARNASAHTRYQPPGHGWRWLIRLMILGAMVISSMLMVHSTTGSVLPGCGPDSRFDCESVLSSQWSLWFGLPVTALAILSYLAVLLLLEVACNGRLTLQRMAWRLLVVVAMAIIIAAIWFVAVQFHLQKFCQYCMLAHGLGAGASLLILILAPIGAVRVTPDEPADALMISPSSAVGLGLFALAGWALLFLGQWFSAPVTHVVVTPPPIGQQGGVEDFDRGSGDDRQISVLSGMVRLYPAQYPMIGSINAPLIALYLYDYTCPNCRLMHGNMREILRKHEGRIALIKLAVPLDAKCNPFVEKTSDQHRNACDLARLALAVWKVDPSKFEAFDDWLMQGQTPPELEQARARAAEMVGSGALDNALADPNIEHRFESTMGLYERTGRGTIPQLIIGRDVIFGRPEPEQLMEIFEKRLPAAR